MIRVEVTQADIDSSEPRICRACPVAQALNRTLSERFGYPIAAAVQDHSAGIYTPSEKYLARIKLPYDVTLKIKAFDKTEIMEPFSFDIRDFSPIDKTWLKVEVPFAHFYYVG